MIEGDCYNNILCSVNVKDLTSKNEYVVDLDISVCFESNGTCAIVASVLSNSHLPKTTCDWSTGLQGKYCIQILICYLVFNH